MRNEFTAVYERDGDWVVAYCPEIPGANGQGYSIFSAPKLTCDPSAPREGHAIS